jgi:hypothetical protein
MINSADVGYTHDAFGMYKILKHGILRHKSTLKKKKKK